MCLRMCRRVLQLCRRMVLCRQGPVPNGQPFSSRQRDVLVMYPLQFPCSRREVPEEARALGVFGLAFERHPQEQISAGVRCAIGLAQVGGRFPCHYPTQILSKAARTDHCGFLPTIVSRPQSATVYPAGTEVQSVKRFECVISAMLRSLFSHTHAHAHTQCNCEGVNACLGPVRSGVMRPVSARFGAMPLFCLGSCSCTASIDSPRVSFKLHWNGE